MLKYADWLNEKWSGDHAKELGIDKKGNWSEIDPNEFPELADEFFDLIKIAYREIGGHAKIKSPKDVFADKEWTWWDIVDLHDTPDVDLICFGKHSRYGIKFAGVGHDGSKIAKREYLDKRGEDLSKLGFFGEVSDKLAEILLKKYKVPSVKTKEQVEQVLGKEIEWHGEHPQGNMPGEGWYSRKIGGKMHTKILVGNPGV